MIYLDCGAEVPFDGKVCMKCGADKSKSQNVMGCAMEFALVGGVIGYLVAPSVNGPVSGAVGGAIICMIIGAMIGFTMKVPIKPVTVNCPHCKNAIEGDPAFFGKEFACPIC